MRETLAKLAFGEIGLYAGEPLLLIRIFQICAQTRNLPTRFTSLMMSEGTPLEWKLHVASYCTNCKHALAQFCTFCTCFWEFSLTEHSPVTVEDRLQNKVRPYRGGRSARRDVRPVHILDKVIKIATECVHQVERHMALWEQ